ncbi:MAG: LTA synthase family protein, partial [Clostridiales bacterium]|nr:LTA synthase family protein [Clostridiales bacterium]
MESETEEKIPDNGKTDAAQIALKALRVVLFILFAAAAFYLMEAYEHNAFTQVRPLAQLFNILLFELVAWTLYLLTGGMRIAMRVLLVIAAAYGLVNHYVMQFRSTPLVPWDIYSVKTAASVASGYDFTPSVRTVLVTLGFVALIALVEVLRHPPKPKFIIRLPAAAIAAVALCLLVANLQDENFQTRMYLYPYLFTPVYMTQVNGMAVTFAMNLQYL